MSEHASIGKRAARAARASVPACGEAAVRAVVFADIVGSTPLYGALGDLRAMSLVTRCLVALEEQVYCHHGEVIKTVGEEMLSVFAGANSGAAAAIAMQQRIQHFSTDAGVPLGLGIGLHCGPVIEERGDVFGDSVNVAARLVKLAGSGQILTDAVSLAAMRASYRRRARALDRHRIKGRSNEIEIVELGWRRRSGEPFTTEQVILIDNAGKSRLLLHAGGEEIALDSARTTFTIGRDDANDLPVVSPKASRQHARIEWRRDKFVLFDHSTNGTYVRVRDEAEVLVKHESYVLRARGVLSLGEPAATSASGRIEFECCQPT